MGKCMTPEIEKRIKAVQAGRVPAGYKKSKVGIVPKEWDVCQLSNYLVINNEKNVNDLYTIDDVFSVSGEYGIVNQIEFMGRSYAGESLSGYRVVYPNDIVYTKSPLKSNPYGIVKANRTDKSGIVSVLYSIYHCKENVVPYYVELYFALDVNLNNYLRPLVHIGPKHNMLISDAHVLDGLIPFPPIGEQKKIAEILSMQDRVIELKEKLIAEKQNQKKYLMSVLLGDDFKKPFKLNGVTIDKKKWEKKRIEDVAIMSSGSTPRRDSKDNFCGNILWLSSGELKQKYICDTEEKISDKAAKESNLRVYPEGTFVIAMYGLEAAGIRGTASIIKAKSTISQACMAFTDLNNITNEFLYYWYLYNGQIIGSKYAQGSKQQNLNSDLMGKIQINLPSLPEQKAIADVLSAADEEISLLQKDLEQEKLKKKSLMQLLLTGLVRVKV